MSTRRSTWLESGVVITALVAMIVLPVSVRGEPWAAAAMPQASQDTAKRLVFRVDPLIVTATRNAKPVFSTPAPVNVLDSLTIVRTKPNTITDMLRTLAGLDVTGVGVQQPRPIIRGQRGQRILLMEDGIRLNNSRRQQDFGEVVSLVDPSQVERVEVVRGPSSVLYGTDAIGGVVNVITRRPMADGWHGRASYLFGAEEDQHRASGALSGRLGRLDLQANVTARRAGDYAAPEGRFGDIRLDRATTVQGTGIDDWNASLRVGWALGRHTFFARGERYEARDAGFGYVDPAAYAPSQPRIVIRYPDQTFTRMTLGWSATDLRFGLADRAELLVYGQDNERTLTFDLFQGFGPQAPPGAGVQVDTRNYSDLRTYGFRLEARKLAGRALFTYGADLFRDGSENTDSSQTAVTGFGPPQTQISNQPLVPDATYRSVGGFAQAEVALGRATVVLGTRVQSIRAEARSGPGLPQDLATKSRSTVVGAANLLYALSDNITLVATAGRGFRAPNLIEWFFQGPTPEGNGYQLRSPDLKPETSFNLDAGIRFRDRRFAAEAFAFRNSVRDGIRIRPTGTRVQGFPAYENVNLDKLRFQGLELTAEANLLAGFSLLATHTRIESQDELDPSNPIGDSYSTKTTGALRWQDSSDRVWAEYAVRHNGVRRDVSLDDNPLGEVLPAFTTHALRGSVLIGSRGRITQRVGLSIENLTNTLYAESTNAGFFRPEPRRRISLSLEFGF